MTSYEFDDTVSSSSVASSASEDEEEESQNRRSRGRRAPQRRRSVTFFEKTKVRKIPGREHMSERQKERVYWSKKDIQNIQDSARRIVESAAFASMSADEIYEMEDHEHDFHGLDVHLPENRRESKQRRRDSIQAVLGGQDVPRRRARRRASIA